MNIYSVSSNWIKKNSKIIIKVMGNIIAVVCIAFIVKTIINLGISADILSIFYKSRFLIIAITALWGMNVFINALNWNKILNFLEGKKINYSEVSEIYIKANIGKYLPGNVMHFVGRNVIGKKYHISQFNMALSTILEIVLSVVITLFYTFLFVGKRFFSLLDLVDKPIIYVIIFLLVLVLLVVCIIKRQKIAEIFKKIILPFTFNKLVNIFVILVLFLANFMLMGITFYLTFRFVCNIEVNLGMFSIIGIFLCSWLIGFVMPGASGGIGVREFVLLLLLSPFYSKDSIVMVIVIHRIITILGDLLAYVLIILMNKIKKRPTTFPLETEMKS